MYKQILELRERRLNNSEGHRDCKNTSQMQTITNCYITPVNEIFNTRLFDIEI